MKANNYEAFDRDEFENTLSALGEFTAVRPRGAKELVYDVPTTADDITVRVFSSVDVRTGRSRDVGNDAIRTVLWSHRVGAVIGGEKRTNRTTGWQGRMTGKISALVADAETFDRDCSCGAHMAVRTVKKGSRKGSKFLGCTRFPACKNTAALTDETADETPAETPDETETETPDDAVACDCGGHFVARKGKYGRFFGCTNWQPRGRGCGETLSERKHAKALEARETETETDAVAQSAEADGWIFGAN